MSKIPVTLTFEEARIVLDKCGNDGHTILRTSALDGVNAAFVAAVTRTYESDGGMGKGQLFTNGQPVESLHGVYTLHALQLAATVLHADTKIADGMLGRGFRARALTVAIETVITSKGKPNV